MLLFEQLQTGVRGLSDHPFRTFLTMLGIVFGVAAVIAMVSIGAGAEREALEELKRFGTNSIRINSRTIEGERLQEVVKKLARGLSIGDAEFLKQACPFLQAVVPEKVTNEKVYILGRKPLATVVGVADGFLGVSRLEVARGRFLSPDEAGTQAQMHASAQYQTQAGTQAQIQAQTQLGTQAQAQGQGQAEAQAQAQAQAQGQGQTKGQIQAQTQTQTKAQIQAQGQLQAQVAVMGAGVASEIFGLINPLGQYIQIGRHRYRVVGVMQEQSHGKGKLAIKSRDHDRDVYIPLPSALALIFPWPIEDKDQYHQVSGLWITVRDGVDLSGARDVVMRILKRLHRGVDDCESLVPLEILQQSQKTQQLFNLVMALIAGISLLVGGIGIMNIMLASVNERTREIGVRRAMGAARRDIVIQFLAESSLISLFGGVLGIGVGIGLSMGIAAYTGWTTVIPVSAVLLAFFVSLSVGMLFGIFPAVKAAKLDPVVALRYE